ncbi:unnamed protein product [Ilex paraguariensis]|uniref:Uncharacterized protein n=1 Tax=Ilex paraguariensis TaxID=185542 RepID=A0ABC8T0J4_9AQUA
MTSLIHMAMSHLGRRHKKIVANGHWIGVSCNVTGRELSFIGNVGLCGVDLPINCTKKEACQGSTHVGEDGDESEVFWFYNGMGIGFALSFWDVCCVLFFKNTWTHAAYYTLLDEVKDQIYAGAMLKVNWFRKKVE